MGISKVFLSIQKLREIIGVLHSYSLIRWKTGRRSFGIHPLVHSWINEKAQSVQDDFHSLIKCSVGLISSNFEKQDLLPPTAPLSAKWIYGEERELNLWPWRKYTDLSNYGKRCLRYVKELPSISEIITHRSLTLL